MEGKGNERTSTRISVIVEHFSLEFSRDERKYIKECDSNDPVVVSSTRMVNIMEKWSVSILYHAIKWK